MSVSVASDRAHAPAILPLRIDHLPLNDLAPYAHFVTWNPVWREGKNGKPGAWTKVPRDPRRPENAESNNPATWGPSTAVIGRFDRIGFVVADDDPFCFLDLDNAVDATGTIKSWAQAIVDRFPSYWERSPSGTGLKGLIVGKPPKNRMIPVGDGKVEMFFSGKYTTLTGHRVEGTSAAIVDCQAELDRFVAEACTEPEPQPFWFAPALDLDDEAIIATALRMPKGRQLHVGGDIAGYESGSEADLGLLCCYVSAGATSPDQLDRLYRSSALYDERAEKWDGRKDYRERTIATALNGRVVPFQPPTPLRRLDPPKNGAVVRNPQDAGFPETTLPDDVAILHQMIRDLSRRLEAAEERAVIAERRAEMLSEVQSKTSRIIGNKALGQERFTAVALSYEFANRESSGDPGENGLHPIPLARIAESAGVSEDAASKHIARLVGGGVLSKELRWVSERVNRQTGEILANGHKRQYIGPASGSVIDFVNAVAALTPEKPKTWGGRADRCQPCPDHPTARIIKRTVYVCEECGQVLGQEPDEVIAASGPNPQDAGSPAESTKPSVVTPLRTRGARVSHNDARGTTVAAAWLEGRPLPRNNAPPRLPDDAAAGD